MITNELYRNKEYDVNDSSTYFNFGTSRYLQVISDFGNIVALYYVIEWDENFVKGIEIIYNELGSIQTINLEGLYIQREFAQGKESATSSDFNSIPVVTTKPQNFVPTGRKWTPMSLEEVFWIELKKDMNKLKFLEEIIRKNK